MRTLEEAWDIIESLNNDAHEQSWDTWIEADALEESEDEDDWTSAEEIRENASLEQADYFREGWYNLSDEDQETVKHWLNHDESFKDQFITYFGEEEFEEEFRDEDE